jgi:hypothetical protein
MPGGCDVWLWVVPVPSRRPLRGCNQLPEWVVLYGRYLLLLRIHGLQWRLRKHADGREQLRCVHHDVQSRRSGMLWRHVCRPHDGCQPLRRVREQLQSLQQRRCWWAVLLPAPPFGLQDGGAVRLPEQMRGGLVIRGPVCLVRCSDRVTAESERPLAYTGRASPSGLAMTTT